MEKRRGGRKIDYFGGAALFCCAMGLTFIDEIPIYEDLILVSATVANWSRARGRNNRNTLVVELSGHRSFNSIRLRRLPGSKLYVGDQIDAKVHQNFGRPDAYQVWELKVNGKLKIPYEKFVKADNRGRVGLRIMCIAIAFPLLLLGIFKGK